MFVSLVLIVGSMALCRTPPLVLGTFNIRRFPAAQTDREQVARAIAELDADAFAVQEIVDAGAFQRVLERAGELTGRDYQADLELARCPGLQDWVFLGVVYDANELTRIGARSLGDGDCPKGQPIGRLTQLRAGDGRELALASVHLPASAGEKAQAERRAQWSWLARALPGLERELRAPVVVAGDFNSTGFLNEESAERRFIDELLGRHALQLPTAELACTEYWQPDKKVAEYRVSALDHVLAKESLEFGEAEVLGMCAALACAPQTAMPPAYTQVSDHCPVRVLLRL